MKRGLALLLLLLAACSDSPGLVVELDPGVRLLRADLPTPGRFEQALTAAGSCRQFDLELEPEPAAALRAAPTFLVQQARLSLEFSPSEGSYSGTAILTLQATAETATLTFDLAATTDSATAQSPTPTFTQANEVLTITPAAPLAPDATWELTIGFHADSVLDLLTEFEEFGGSLLGNEVSPNSTFFTYGYAYFPWPQGQPLIQGLEAEIRYPKGMSLIVAAEKTGTSETNDQITETWRTARVQNRLSLALARYKIARGTCGSSVLEVAAINQPESIDGFPLRPETYATVIGKLCTEFVRRFGEPRFPTIRFAGVDDRFVNGLSTPGLVLVPNFVFDDDGNGSFIERDFFLAHELAHQWWGNDVKTARRDRWLTEGMADYVTCESLKTLYTGSKTDRWIWLFEVEPLQRALYIKFEDHPLTADVEAQTAVIIYIKGAWVLRMLETVLGPAPMEELLRTVREAHPFSTLTTEEFTAAAADIAGQDLSWFTTQWLTGTGLLSLRTDFAKTEGELAVTVTQTIPWTPDSYFQAPLLIRATDADRSVERDVQLNDQTATFTLPVP